MNRKSKTGKVLEIISTAILEAGAFIYPYKGIGKSLKKYQGSLSHAIYNLKRNGCLEEVESNGQKQLNITFKGKLRLISRKITGKWDGYWRIIAFDIEEKRKHNRNIFRAKLVELGCRVLQKSVWITPHDISFELEAIIDLLDLHDNVDYFLSKALTNEEKYLKLFNLQKD